MPAGVKLTNIQNVNLNTAGNAGLGLDNQRTFGNTFDTSVFASVTATNVVSAGGSIDLVQASNKSTINVQHNNVHGAVSTLGGSNVLVNTNGTGVDVGGYWNGSSQSFPSGTVTVNANGYLEGSGHVDVEGGTDVTVTVAQKTATGNVNIGNVDGTALTTGSNPTGAINVTRNSVGGRADHDIIFGGTTVNVNVKGDTVVVGDPDTPLDQASNLASGAITVSNNQAKTYNNVTNTVKGGIVHVAGGSSVTVNTNTGGGVIVGADLTSADQNALINTDGAVVVTDTSTDASGAFGLGGAYVGGPSTAVYGGSTVNVTEAGGSVTVGGTNKNTTPTGSVTITETRDSNQKVTINGGNGITVSAKGQTVVAGDATSVAGAVLVNQNSVYSGDALGSSNLKSRVEVYGGTTVTVNTTGGHVVVGDEDQTNGLPTGAVNITNTFSGANGANNAVVEVQGGTTVNISVANTTDGDIHVGHVDPVFNGTGTALVNAKSFASGNVTIDNAVTFGDTTYYGDSDVIVRTNGAQTVTIAGASAVEVTDINVLLAPATGKAVGTSSLATVNLTGILGDATLTSDALTAVSVSDSDSGVEVVNAKDHALSLTVNDSLLGLTDDKATAISITATGENAIDLNSLTATALSINNSGATAVLASTGYGIDGMAKLATVTANGSGALELGDLTEGHAANLKSIDASGATGSVHVALTVDQATFKGGAGDDIVVADVTTGLDGQKTRVDGGAGNNTVVINEEATLYNPTLNPGGPMSANFTNFQNIAFALGANGTYDVSGFNDVTVADRDENHVFGPLVLTNAGANETLTFATSGISPLQAGPVVYSQKTDTAADALTVNLGSAKSFMGYDLNSAVDAILTVSKIETLTVNSNQTVPGQTFDGVPLPLDFNRIDVFDSKTTGTVAAIKTLNVTGTADVEVNLATDAAVNTVNKIVVTNTGDTDVTGVNLSGGSVSISGGAGLLAADLSDTLSARSDKAVDVVTSGSGGIDLTLGNAGATGYVTEPASTGSQTVNLAASAATRDTINVLDTVHAVDPTTLLPVKNLGTNAMLNSFKLGDAGKNSDQLNYADNKIILKNGSYTYGGKDYTASNGVISVVSSGVALLDQLNAAKAIVTGNATTGTGGGANNIAAIVYGGSTYVVTASNTDDPIISLNDLDKASVVQLVGVTNVTGFGSATVDGVAGGAGGTVMVESFEQASYLNVTDSTNLGSSTVDKTYSETGYTVAQMLNHAKGVTTTYNGLAAWGVVGVGADNIPGNSKGGNLVVNQTGASQYLTLGAIAGDASLNTVTFNAAGLNINSSNGAIAIESLVNSSNTAATITISNSITGPGSAVAIGSITDTALTTIDATESDGNVTLGVFNDVTGAVKTSLSQAGLTVLGGYGDLHVALSGANATVTSAEDTDGDYTVVTSGANSTVSVGYGTNEITIRGANSTVNLGSNLTSDIVNVGTPGAPIPGAGPTVVFADQTIHTTSVGATINFVTETVDGQNVYFSTAGKTVIDGGTVTTPTMIGVVLTDVVTHQGIAANTTINMANFAAPLLTGDVDPIDVASDSTVNIYTAGVLTGTTSTGAYATTTFNNVVASDPTESDIQATISIVLDNLKANGLDQLNEITAGDTLAHSQVNVASATTLAQALDLAAATASLSGADDAPGAADGKIAAGTGIVNWFQFGGNTYIVETINAGTSAAAQTGLDANDAVITLTGLVDLTNADFTDGAVGTAEIDAIVITTTGVLVAPFEPI